MFMLLVELLTLIASLGTVEVRHEPFTMKDAYGVRRYSAGMTCNEGAPVLYLPRWVAFEGIVHEYAHALDCLDDAAMDGSPGHPRPLTRPDGVSSYCYSNPAEFYACEVVRTGLVR